MDFSEETEIGNGLLMSAVIGELFSSLKKAKLGRLTMRIIIDEYYTV